MDPSEQEDVLAEHRRLLEQMQALMQEFADLHQRPRDIAAHQAYRAKLRKQIEELHAHTARLKLLYPE